MKAYVTYNLKDWFIYKMKPTMSIYPEWYIPGPVLRRMECVVRENGKITFFAEPKPIPTLEELQAMDLPTIDSLLYEASPEDMRRNVGTYNVATYEIVDLPEQYMEELYKIQLQDRTSIISILNGLRSEDAQKA